MTGKLGSIFNTIKHLKPTQIVYQLKYRLKRPQRLVHYNKAYNRINRLFFTEQPPVFSDWNGENSFIFLNQPVDFGNEINWDFQGNGKLWNYNLQYAGYILQKDISPDAVQSAASSLYDWLNNGRLLLEPYPVSLRSINMIRWFCRHESPDVYTQLKENVHAELDFLSGRMEYHLLGNHLLENAFALMMGGVYYHNTHWVKKAKTVLASELDEQILEDGAHFELSPMYHKILFFRLLELIDWYSKSTGKEIEFENFLRAKASDMRSWLENISFSNGDVPHFNDSTEGIAYPVKWLCSYSDRLSVRAGSKMLGISGYRSIGQNGYECKIDVAQLGPDYQPGHAHADALSFILYYKGKPLFIEAGTSTYETGAGRDYERSTGAHNTVTINGENQSEVYGGFRVGRRACTFIITDEINKLSALHDGYFKKYKIKHQRSFDFNGSKIIITDFLNHNPGNRPAVARFHIHPQVNRIIDGEKIVLPGIGCIHFVNYTYIEIEEFDYAVGFNKKIKSNVIKVSFMNSLITEINFNK